MANTSIPKSQVTPLTIISHHRHHFTTPMANTTPGRVMVAHALSNDGTSEDHIARILRAQFALTPKAT
jgi:hypothetical protein